MLFYVVYCIDFLGKFYCLLPMTFAVFASLGRFFEALGHHLWVSFLLGQPSRILCLLLYDVSVAFSRFVLLFC